MKTRILGAAVGIAAVLGSLLVASPAQASDGPDWVRVYYSADLNGGEAQATVDFVSRTVVVWRDFTVQDTCPGDGLPVRARPEWTYADGTRGVGAWRADTNGCGQDGTNFGDIRISRSKAVARVAMTVCVYSQSEGNLRCATSQGRDNQYV